MNMVSLEITDDQCELVLRSLQLNHARYSKLRDQADRIGAGSTGPRGKLEQLDELIAIFEEG